METFPPLVQWIVASATGAGLFALAGRWVLRGGRAELEDALAKKFATLGQLNGLGEKVTAMQRVAELANEQAEEALSTAERATDRMELLEGQVLPRLDEISRQMVKQGEHLAKQTGVLETFMDEYRRNRR
jgi:hypothetical protein